MDPKTYFDRVVLINLKRRPDRLARITEHLHECKWPFKWPKVFPAIDGSIVASPEGWQSGGGAWGCMRSHQQIFERAMMDKVKSLLILEDDACFAPDFTDKVMEFLNIVPEDWDQLMLGGQHINQNGTPVLIKPGVYRCTDCERTHCYAIRGDFLTKLYQRWVRGGDYNGEVHCDWIMGRDPSMQASHHVYAPERFLVGQDRGKSDINGGIHARKFWNPPSSDLPVIFLQAPPSLMPVLRQHGFHTGFNRDVTTDIDNGLTKIFSATTNSEGERAQRLRSWINDIQWEVASDPFRICTIWHPEATLELVQRASTWPVFHISSDTVDEVFSQLPQELRRSSRPSLARSFVISLRVSRRVAEGLKKYGFHMGYWINEETGIDNGLINLCKEYSKPEERVTALAAVIKILQSEAETIHNGVATIWHPDIETNLVNAATIARVIEIKSKSIREALEQWEEAKDLFYKPYLS